MKITVASVLVLGFASLHAVAQSTAIPGLFQNRSGQSEFPGPVAQGQYRYCTPAEYGDPTADCIPVSRGQSTYDIYDGSGPINPNVLSPYELGGAQAPQPYTRSRDSSMNPNGEPAARNVEPALREKEPPTEFQRYVADSAGQLLPIFGASLFERVPATFAPLDQVPVSPDYLIAPGDELQVSIWGQFTFSRRLIVDRAGQVMLPDAGPVAVSGMTYSNAASVFRAALSHYYKNFDLNVALGRLHSIQIFVVGEARRPGSYNVSSFSTLVNAIFASGGPSARGSMRNIQLRRGDKCIHEFDLYDLLTQGDKSNDSQLSPGDTIFIAPAGPRVAVLGSVEHPAIYELKATTTVGEVLRLADGLSPLASRKQVLLERVEQGSDLRALRIPMTSEGLKTELKNGDVVRLIPVVQRFERTVAIRGNVADPGRFPWHEEMHISELIPNKEALLTRDYWTARNGLSSNVTMIAEQDQSGAARPQTTAPPQVSDANRTSVQPVGAVLAPSSRSGQMFYREQSRNVQGDASLGAAREVDSLPPVRSFTPRNLVQQLAPDIDWEYAVVERIDASTLSTRVIPFNLGGLVLRGDKTQDLLLEPGDVVTIFSTADFSVPQAQQLKQVTIEGEVARAGVYTIAPGETLREVVARAGGLTRNAYLYGAQFTRESTRREQQKRYEDFLNRFDEEVSQAASNLSSRVTSPQEALTAQTSLSSQRDLLDRLRKISMNGRIVLDMAPNSVGATALPDLPLENGDRLFVPSRPATVNVIGTVFEQTSFLYEEDLRTGDYLKKAGGPARSADRAHAFVIRADGSVVSRSTGNVLFARSFENLTMHPGDTVVVPLLINRPTFIRTLIDWSQVFSNFALGAAAVNVLH